MSKRGYVKFTGDYSKLKDMGYGFQKLYASNYMQWEKNGFRIWKKGHDITHDEYNLYKLITFFRTNPKMRITSYKDGQTTFVFYKFYKDAKAREYEFRPYDEEHHQIYGDTIRRWGKVTDNTPKEEMPLPHTTICVTKEFLDQLQGLKDMGLYELIEYKPKNN